MPKVIVMRSYVWNRPEKTEPRRPIYDCKDDCIRGQVWEHVSPKGEVYQTLEFRRVRKDGSESRYPFSFPHKDLFSLTHVIYDCYNWLGFYRGEHLLPPALDVSQDIEGRSFCFPRNF